MNAIEVLQLPELAPALERLEDLLARSAGADDPFLTEVARHLISAGGKRLRPSLAIAAALAGGGQVDDDVLLGGVAVELVHLASLYHDDVMDEATARRGVSSVNARWGNNVAVVSGDFLLARAAGIAARLGTEVAVLLADTLAALCEGQVIECQSLFDVGRTEDAYFAAVRGKTASLMATSCRIGALVAGHSPDETEALTRFGLAFGMAFQVVDDVLDVVGDEEELGKATGQDLAEGVYTLPTLRALDEPGSGPELRDLLGKPLDDVEREKVRSIVAAGSGVTQAVDLAMGYAASASAEIRSVARAPVGAALERLGVALIDSMRTTAS